MIFTQGLATLQLKVTYAPYSLFPYILLTYEYLSELLSYLDLFNIKLFLFWFTHYNFLNLYFSGIIIILLNGS